MASIGSDVDFGVDLGTHKDACVGGARGLGLLIRLPRIDSECAIHLSSCLIEFDRLPCILSRGTDSGTVD